MSFSEHCVVAVGSTRPPKVHAAKAAFRKISGLPEFSKTDFSFHACSVESGVSGTPRSLEEMMLGAKLRVENLRAQLIKENIRADFRLGMEGGLFTIKKESGDRRVFLQSWVYAANGETGHFGSSPAIELPRVVLQAFGENDFELADVMDDLTRRANTREKGGAYAILTCNLLTRQGIFEQATLSALAPFYNSAIYGR